MKATNPFAPPQATVADRSPDQDAIQPIRIWPPNGRIGRLRFLAYAMSIMLALVVWTMIVSVIVRAMGGAGPTSSVAGLVALLATVVVVCSLYIQRAHDMNWSGWASLLCLVPLVNLVFTCIFIFKAGTPGSNEYGAPPPPNGVWVKMGVFVLIVVAFLGGIFAAIAMPQYQESVQRARAAVHQ